MLLAYGIMWSVFGVSAIITAGLNIIWTIKGKDAKWFRFISISLTALTLCAFYSQGAVWVLHKDWGALEDVFPAMSRGIWKLTFISIALNSISLLKRKNK